MRKIVLLVFFVTLLASCKKENPKVIIKTTRGDIEVEVYSSQAPKTAANFLKHVDHGDYKNSWFYRTVRKDNQPTDNVRIQVLQGGLFYDNLITRYRNIPHETTKKTGILHKDGTVSMARITPGTASTEFFICVGNQPQLDYGGKRNPDGKGFAAFARVIKGMDIVRKLHQSPDSFQFIKPPVKILNIVREK